MVAYQQHGNVLENDFEDEENYDEDMDQIYVENHQLQATGTFGAGSLLQKDIKCKPVFDRSETIYKSNFLNRDAKKKKVYGDRGGLSTINASTVD